MTVKCESSSNFESEIRLQSCRHCGAPQTPSVSQTIKATAKRRRAPFYVSLIVIPAIGLALTVRNTSISAQNAQTPSTFTIVKDADTSSGLDLYSDSSGKALRIFAPSITDPRTYFNSEGMLYTNGWMVISGTYDGTGDDYNVFHPSPDSFMLGIWSDVDGPALQVRSAHYDDSYIFSGLNHSGKYIFSIEEDGKIQWGESTRESMDTQLYRDSAGTLRTPGSVIVDGDVQASSVRSFSDQRLKTNVQRLHNVLEKLDQIHGVSFEWNKLSESINHHTGQRGVGLIGQEVEATFPELVTRWGKDQYLTIDYGRMVAILVEAIKELNGSLNELRSQLQLSNIEQECYPPERRVCTGSR
jgi:hypothetical protein